MPEIKTLLSRGVDSCLVREDLEAKLRSGKPLRIKFGIDPTGTDIHLGHAIPLRKLAQFQKLGHTVIFLFGGFTATIGDPTGKNETRPPLSLDEVEKNAEKYLEQASKFLDIKKCEIRNNRDWFQKMPFSEIMKLMAQKSAQQILARRDFSERFKKEIDIHLTEFLYPMLQGYDSVVLESDVEIGGNDQLFNILVGRDLQKKYESKTIQNVLTVEILEGLDGVEKMSKSLGNYIALQDTPREIFGKTMSIPDSLMKKWFLLLTDFTEMEIVEILSGHPRDAKLRLALELTKVLHDEPSAHLAQEEFLKMFQKKEIPDDIEEVYIDGEEKTLLEVVSRAGFGMSNSEIRRMIEAGSVRVDGVKSMNFEERVDIGEGRIVQVGKRKFVKICRKK